MILRPSTFVALSVIGSIACRDTPPKDRALSSANVGFTAAESLYYLDPKEGCEFLLQNANPDPVALVQEFNRRDNEGQFLQTNRWLDSAYDCPGHLPGPDEFNVVQESRVVESKLTDTVAHIVVRSTMLGGMSQDSIGPVFQPAPAAKLDTFVVARTPYGWRIRSPQLPDNVLASWVLANPDRIRLRPANRDSLSQALGRVAPNGR